MLVLLKCDRIWQIYEKFKDLVLPFFPDTL